MQYYVEPYKHIYGTQFNSYPIIYTICIYIYKNLYNLKACAY